MRKKTLYSYSTSFSFFIIHILLLLLYHSLYHTYIRTIPPGFQNRTKTSHLYLPRLFRPGTTVLLLRLFFLFLHRSIFLHWLLLLPQNSKRVSDISLYAFITIII